ncbi:MAG: response regulator transcription factor [Bacteroidia bacterium]|nr:response regulator transcription factor [Bacteroidia bacterium]
MNSNKKIKIIIADDHKIFLEGLSSLLKDYPELEIIATVSNGQEVLDLLIENKADVVVTDINMPIMDGIKLTKELKKKHPNIKVLALTMHNEDRIITTIIKAGVTGYILKDTRKEELLTAIKTVFSGENYFSDEVKNSLNEKSISKKATSTNSSLIELSDREQDILKLIAAGLTQQQIAEKIFISEHTVVFHKRKLFVKFDCKNTAELIKYAMDFGFVE